MNVFHFSLFLLTALDDISRNGAFPTDELLLQASPGQPAMRECGLPD